MKNIIWEITMEEKNNKEKIAEMKAYRVMKIL